MLNLEFWCAVVRIKACCVMLAQKQDIR